MQSERRRTKAGLIEHFYLECSLTGEQFINGSIMGVRKKRSERAEFLYCWKRYCLFYEAIKGQLCLFWRRVAHETDGFLFSFSKLINPGDFSVILTFNKSTEKTNLVIRTALNAVSYS